MLDTRQGFGEEIGDVYIARDVLHPELFPLDPILQPVKPHVDTLGEAWSHRLGRQADSTLIVA